MPQLPNQSAMFNIREDKQILVFYKRQFECFLNIKSLPENQFLSHLQSVYNNIQNSILKKQDAEAYFRMAFTAYSIRFGQKLYPSSSHYFAAVLSEIISFNANTNPASPTVHYMAQRQNYLENRMEEMALSFEKKGTYHEAQKIYNYSGLLVAPFNVKVAQLLFLQSKFKECIQYCNKAIQFMSQYPIQRFLKYIIQVATYDLKSQNKLKNYKATLSKGQNYVNELKKKNPRLQYEKQDLENTLMVSMFKAYQNKTIQSTLKNGQNLLKPIYRQEIIALIELRSLDKAKQYLKLIQVKKVGSNSLEQIQFYYHSRFLQILILKAQNKPETIKLINQTYEEVTQDKKLDNKDSYTKFLLKLKLQILISSQNIQKIIKQAEDIVKINPINLIFIKQQLFSVISKKSSKIHQILSQIESSELLKCLLPQLVEKAKSLFGDKLQNQNTGKDTNEILSSIEKIYKSLDNADFIENQQDNQQPFDKNIYDLEQKPENYLEKTDLEDFEDESAVEKYEGQICRIKGKNGIEYVVLFEKKMAQGLQKSEYRRFVCASDHFCIRDQGSTGIKVNGNEIRLKTRASTRLTGKLVPNKNNNREVFLHFTKRENHDDYKRAKK